MGRHAQLVSELDRLVARHPLWERLRAQHMLALYRSGRQAEALASYNHIRNVLAEELGIDPGLELQELMAAVLRQDPSLVVSVPHLAQHDARERIPETRYARSGDVSIAYQVFGEGPVDLVWVPGYVSNVEYVWQYPPTAKWARGLGSFARVIAFDKRGTGLSDRVSPDSIPDLETRMDDVRAVMDAVGSDRAVLLGLSEGGPMSILFAATHPERTVALIVYGAPARYAWAPDYPGGYSQEGHERYLEDARALWGTRELAAAELRDWAAPSMSDDAEAIEWFAGFMRAGGSPGAGVAVERMLYEIDVRDVLPLIRVPTLVIHREGDKDMTAAGSYMAERIPGAKLVVLPGEDHMPWFGDMEAVLGTIESFVQDVRDEEAGLGGVLATVLFTHVVGPSADAATLEAQGSREFLERHRATIRAILRRYRGTEVSAVGDGFLSTFDGPARAVRCAWCRAPKPSSDYAAAISYSWMSPPSTSRRRTSLLRAFPRSNLGSAVQDRGPDGVSPGCSAPYTRGGRDPRTPAEDEDVVEALPWNGPDPSFRDGVGLWRTNWRPHHGEPIRPEDLIEGAGELRVSVPEQDVPFLQASSDREVPSLLGDPGRVGSAGRAGHVDPSRGELDEEQDVQRLQEDRLDREEDGM